MKYTGIGRTINKLSKESQSLEMHNPTLSHSFPLLPTTRVKIKLPFVVSWPQSNRPCCLDWLLQLNAAVIWDVENTNLEFLLNRLRLTYLYHLTEPGTNTDSTPLMCQALCLKLCMHCIVTIILQRIILPNS